MMEVDSIYVCHTPYHVLIATAKVLSGRQRSSALLMDTIPDVDSLAKRLEREDVFEDVVVAGVGRPFRSQSYYKTLLDDLLFRHHTADLVSYVAGHKNIFLFNDISELGCLLMRRGVKYHLLEDGLDAFKLFDQRKLSSGNTPARRLLGAFFKIPNGLGDSDCCVSIEVNDAEGLATRIDKPIVVVPRKDLFTSLEAAQVRALCRLFNLANLDGLNGAVLVLTTPFAELGYTEKSILDYYASVVDCFGGPGCCWIKPHPRDQQDYTSIVGPCNIIDRRMPVELLSFVPSLRLRAVVSYNSTSVGSLDLAERRFVTKPGLVMKGVENLCIDI